MPARSRVVERQRPHQTRLRLPPRTAPLVSPLAKILYGVVGEGDGPRDAFERRASSTSSPRGTSSRSIASGRATDFLAKRFEGVNRIARAPHDLRGEPRSPRQTLWSNVLTGADGRAERCINAYFELVRQLQAGLRGERLGVVGLPLREEAHRLPILSIDNLQIINRCTHDDEILKAHRAEFELTPAFVKTIGPAICRDSLRHHDDLRFHPPDPRMAAHRAGAADPPAPRSSRRRDRRANIYSSTKPPKVTTLSEIIAKTGLECRIYGMRREITEEQVDRNPPPTGRSASRASSTTSRRRAGSSRAAASR